MRPENGWRAIAELNRAISRHAELFRVVSTGNQAIVKVEADGAITVAEDLELISTDKALAVVCSDLGYQVLKT